MALYLATLKEHDRYQIVVSMTVRQPDWLLVYMYQSFGKKTIATYES
jgi:hypothetical protein